MKSGMLLISNPNIILRALPLIQTEIKTIYIQYFPLSKWRTGFSPNNTEVKTAVNWPLYSSKIVGIYSKMLRYKHLEVRVILSGIKSHNLCAIMTKTPIDVVYYDQILGKEEVQKYVNLWLQNKTTNCQINPLENQNNVCNENDNIKTSCEDQLFDNVVLGGTFDRLHNGHKILLSEAILHCRKKITVGVTDFQMLTGKKLWELIEPCDIRIQNVKDFLEEVDPSLEYNVIPINDIYGPTKDDPTFQMIVVSSETVGGGSKINEIRLANDLNPLCIHQVELMADLNKEDEEEEDKISSSNLRLRCLGTLLRDPQPNVNIPERPYIVGLTGGIASGKSNIAQFLETFGAGIVNCDQLAHFIYRVGSPGHRLVVEHFGQDILDHEGAIDRKKLGAIVFGNKAKLDVLNGLLWPLILEEAMVRTRQLHSQGHVVVVLEAAVLLPAGWDKSCHEVWVTIVPPQEAVKRVMQRNGLLENEARARVDAQPTNLEQVQQANIVFSSLWRTEFTRKQVTKAWLGLKERLNIP